MSGVSCTEAVRIARLTPITRPSCGGVTTIAPTFGASTRSGAGRFTYQQPLQYTSFSYFKSSTSACRTRRKSWPGSAARFWSLAILMDTGSKIAEEGSAAQACRSCRCRPAFLLRHARQSGAAQYGPEYGRQILNQFAEIDTPVRRKIKNNLVDVK